MAATPTNQNPNCIITYPYPPDSDLEFKTKNKTGIVAERVFRNASTQKICYNVDTSFTKIKAPNEFSSPPRRKLKWLLTAENRYIPVIMNEKVFILPKRWDGKAIASVLWKDPETLISNDMIRKVNIAEKHIRKQNFELGGVKADGNCFFGAFLGSYLTINKKIPLLDEQPDKISYLRAHLSDLCRFKNPERADEIKKDTVWINMGEGELLAPGLDVAIRIVTINGESSGYGISDMLSFPNKKEDPQEWNEIPTDKKPNDFIFIIDLGGHFIFAEKPSLPLNKSPKNFNTTRSIAHLFDDRETRSTIFSTGRVKFQGFDPKTNEITVKFDSYEKYLKFNRKIGIAMARQGHYAIAKHFTQNANDITSLQWLQKALESTSEQIRKENGGEWKSVQYSGHAEAVSKTLAEKKADYAIAIMNVKKAFKALDFKTFLENIHQANHLNPDSFEPHFFTLMLVYPLSGFRPEEAKKIIDDAYAISPLLTYNVLIIRIIIIFNSSSIDTANFQTFFRLFLQRFPHDVSCRMLATTAKRDYNMNLFNDISAQEKEYRRLFSDHLGEALTAVRKKNLEPARDAFSLANHHWISDKRPYLYKALIDLKSGDILSARKSMIALEHIVNWSRLAERDLAINQCYNHIDPEYTSSAKPSKKLETRILETLIKIVTGKCDENVNKSFFDDFVQYLQDPEADFIWTSLLTEVLQDYIKNKIHQIPSDSILSLINLHSILPRVTFYHLQRLGANISDYQDMMKVGANGAIQIQDIHYLTSLATSPSTILIEQNSFEISDDQNIIILKEIFWESYRYFSSLHLPQIDIDKILSLLEKLPNLETPLDEFFFPAFMQHLSDKGASEHKVRLLQCAIKKLPVFLPEQRLILTDHLFRWQLSQPVPCQNNQLLHMEKEWLAAIKVDLSTINTDLGIAYKAWLSLQKSELEQAEFLCTSFFEEWKSRSAKDPDLVALRILYLVCALLQEPGIASGLTTPKSERHAKLMRLALTMIAREGTPSLYTVPTQAMTKEALQIFCHFHIGQRRKETDEQYRQRLKTLIIPNLSDIRKTKNVQENVPIDTTQTGWEISFLGSSIPKRINEFIEREMELNRLRIDHNRQIKSDEETAQYGTDAFIQWVIDHGHTIISKYLKNTEGVVSELTAFAKLSDKHKGAFLDQLEEKCRHEIDFQLLKRNTPKAFKRPGERFWQLIEQTSILIDHVGSGTRDEETYNMVVKTEEEAHFVMLLIYEWGRETYPENSLEELGDYFHGPEIHVWANGPRISHFNAGVYLGGGKPRNGHIFFDK